MNGTSGMNVNLDETSRLGGKRRARHHAGQVPQVRPWRKLCACRIQQGRHQPQQRGPDRARSRIYRTRGCLGPAPDGLYARFRRHLYRRPGILRKQQAERARSLYASSDFRSMPLRPHSRDKLIFNARIDNLLDKKYASVCLFVIRVLPRRRTFLQHKCGLPILTGRDRRRHLACRLRFP